ncbi:MAG: selenium cofactor biosynthesis protein YqeC [Gammaproteobacteria bacterium]
MSDIEPAEPALVEALAAARGVVCLVGAGGKKTTMYALARAHRGRVALSSTSHMYRYDDARVERVVEVTDDRPQVPADARVVAFAGPTDTPERVGGLSIAALAALRDSGAFELLLVKADGARARWIKAPGDHEPLVLPWADTVVAVVSAGVLGRRLDSGIAHRPERVAAVTGAALDEPLTAAHLATLLSSEAGLLKGVGAATVVPLINMVDDADRAAAARASARLALAATTRFDRVVLAAMKRGRLVEVVRR